MSGQIWSICKCGAWIKFLHLLQLMFYNLNNHHLPKLSNKSSSGPSMMCIWRKIIRINSMTFLWDKIIEKISRGNSAFISTRWGTNLDEVYCLYWMDSWVKSNVSIVNSSQMRGVWIQERDIMIKDPLSFTRNNFLIFPCAYFIDSSKIHIIFPARIGESTTSLKP